MTKKQALTKEFIEKDILNAFKLPSGPSKASYNKSLPFAVISAILLVVIEIFFPRFILWALLALFVYLLGYAVYKLVKQRILITRFSIEDYGISIETVKNTHEEHYKIKGKKYIRSQQTSNYSIAFENGQLWNIPKDNYLWSVERPMSDLAIFQSTNCGDEMIVVTNKDNKKIVMAYHTDFFEYKN